MKLHPPPLPPAPGAKVQREEEEGNGVGTVGATGTKSREEAASDQLGILLSPPVHKDPTGVQALPLAGPTLYLACFGTGSWDYFGTEGRSAPLNQPW